MKLTKLECNDLIKAVWLDLEDAREFLAVRGNHRDDIRSVKRQVKRLEKLRQRLLEEER